MARLARIVSWVLVFVALSAAAVSWFQPQPELDEDDAVETVVGALAEVDLEATVTDPVVLSGHVTDAGDAVDVWVVFATVGAERIEARVLVDQGQLVYVDDRIGGDLSGRLLDDDQFASVDRYRSDATVDEFVRLHLLASITAVVIAAVALVLAKRSDRLWRR